jgi:serine/threonine-protein kinase
MALCSTCGAECPVEPLCDACAAQVTKQAGTAAIAGFTLLRQMGTGRFGASYLGYTAEGVTAVKVLHAKPASAEVAQRFLFGAANASAVSGPTVARLLTAGQLADGRLYLVHEYGGDQSLADVLRSHGRLSPPHALDVCAEVAEALAAAHERGINHRDLKAANVGLWLDEDQSELVRVLDSTTWHVFKRSGLHESGPVPLSSAATASPE